MKGIPESKMKKKDRNKKVSGNPDEQSFLRRQCDTRGTKKARLGKEENGSRISEYIGFLCVFLGLRVRLVLEPIFDK